jgi:hypothetical protein
MTGCFNPAGTDPVVAPVVAARVDRSGDSWNLSISRQSKVKLQRRKVKRPCPERLLID